MYRFAITHTRQCSYCLLPRVNGNNMKFRGWTWLRKGLSNSKQRPQREQFCECRQCFTRGGSAFPSEWKSVCVSMFSCVCLVLGNYGWQHS